MRGICSSSSPLVPAPGPSRLLHFSPTARFDATAVYSRSLPRRRPGQLLFTLDYARGNRAEVLTLALCSGLILLYDAFAKAYYLCNATTRAVTRLPPFCDAMRLSTTGLGFDTRTREHKVVRLINNVDTIRCEVYMPGGGGSGDRWRAAAGAVPLGLRRFASSAVHHAELNRLPPVFANGFLHWLVDPCLEFASPGDAIVPFSFTEETFGCVRSPPLRASEQLPFWAPPGVLPPCAPEAHLVEMDSQLCMVQDIRKNPYNSNLDIWRLLDYSSGDWSLDYRIDLSGRIARGLCEPQTVRVVGSTGSCRSGKKIIVATCKHKVHQKFENSKSVEGSVYF